MNFRRGILFSLGIVASCIGSLSGQIIVYPYRFDTLEHPDYALRHYQAPTWESTGGRIHSPVELIYRKMNKITRIAGVDKNSFPANLDLKEYHAEINGWREEYGLQYAGKHIGESDAGFVHFNHRYESLFSRDRENHYLSFVDFLDSYGRVTDYQVCWGINLGLAHAAYAQGYVTMGHHQTHHPQYYQVIYAFLRGAAKQYGVTLCGGLTDTYQRSSEAFRKKNMEAYELARQKLANMDPDKVTWRDRFDVKATLRRANEALDPDGSPFSYSYRYWYTGYQYNLTEFRHLEGLRRREKGTPREERELTELGLLHRHFEEQFLPAYPDPGGMYAPVAFMMDFFNGWVGRDDSAANRHHEAIAWDGVPFDRADYQLSGFLQLVYPDYLPHSTRKSNLATEGGFSHTPFGDCAEIIQSDVRPELLEQYGLVVLAGKFRTELAQVRGKLGDYLKQGGEVFLCAEQLKAIWPERVPAGGREVVRIPFGKGVLAVSPTPYGLQKEEHPEKGNFSFRLQDHVKTYLRRKIEALRLFSVGDDLAYIINRNADGIYMLGIYNGQYNPLPFSIKSHIGEIVELREIPTGDVNIIKSDARFYAPREVEAGSWGSSDKNTIGGGEVRMFEIRVDEQNVRQLEKVKYPPRPKCYLSMGMKNLRRNIQLRPSFFQQFSGVMLDASDLLQIDDMALEYEYGWYRVRHVEMLVDARQIADAGLRQELKRKMALLPHARFLGSELIEGESRPAEFLTIGEVGDGNPYLALRGIDDLSQWLGKHPGFFDNFSGVMLDSDYLFQRNRGAWKKEAALLRQYGIGIVVDFSSRVKMYRDISFQPTMPLAPNGRDMFDNVLQKMADTSLCDAVMPPPCRTYDRQTGEALETYASQASELGVTLHLRMILSLGKPGRMARALRDLDQSNLRVAYNPLVSYDIDTDLPVDLVLPARVDPGTSERLPFHGSPIKAVPKGAIAVFDAEYLEWQEIVRDARWWNQKSGGKPLKQ